MVMSFVFLTRIFDAIILNILFDTSFESILKFDKLKQINHDFFWAKSQYTFTFLSEHTNHYATNIFMRPLFTVL